jgi:hypothetical protein
VPDFGLMPKPALRSKRTESELEGHVEDNKK